MEFLIGADPEVFVRKGNTFFSAFGLIKGDKKNPFPVNKGAVQVDGMALEFNIDPARTEEEFCINIQTVFNTLRGMVPEYEVVATPVAQFTDKYLKQQPKEALELGCDPDFNAWMCCENRRPVAVRPIRTASGHVHIGWGSGFSIHDPEHLASCMEVIKQMDFFLGLPSLMYDDDVERRELYGKAGAYRPKSYGAEYRVLSNMWLNSEKLMGWVFRNSVLGMNRLLDGDNLSQRFGDIQQIINESNVREAAAIINAANIPVPEA